MTNSNFNTDSVLVNIKESTYTATIYVGQEEKCIRLKSGLTHNEAIAHAEAYAASKGASLDIVAIGGIVDFGRIGAHE